VSEYFDMASITVSKNCLYRDKNVYTVGIGLAGQVLEGFSPPFALVIDIRVVSREGSEKSATFKKITGFNKIIGPYGLYAGRYCSFPGSIHVYYECLFINLNDNEMQQAQVRANCMDSGGRNVFDISGSFDEIPMRWDKSITVENMEIHYSGAEETIIAKTMTDELYASYKMAQDMLDMQFDKKTLIYVTACPRNIYDIVSDFPISATNSVAFGDDKIFMVLDGREDIGITFSPHEFCHLLLNKLLGKEIGGADKAFIEGICEYASEKYRLDKGWLECDIRASIGTELIKRVYKCTIAGFLKKKAGIDREIPFEYYIMLPSIIKNILHVKKIDLKELVRDLHNNETIYDILAKTIDDADSFLEEYEKYIQKIDSDLAGKIYDLYSKRYYIFSSVTKDMSAEELANIRRKDILFQRRLMCGDITGAGDLLYDKG
jgi:hypothetical protein